MITLTYILSFFATFLILIHLSATVYTIFYQKYLYPRQIRARYNHNYFPSVGVIVAIKNIPPDFDTNFSSLLKQDYPNYEIIFAVESQTDPAYQYIQPYLTQHPHLKLIVSTLATRCCQKNQNLIAAVEQSNKPEVYIFADDDSALNNQWIRELITPLSDPRITATSTYFWPYSSRANLTELIHVYMNIYTYTLYCFCSSFLSTPLLWAGSIAIRRQVFEKLEIKKYWQTNISDDTYLSKILSTHRHKTVFVTTAISQNNAPINKISDITNWYTRQLMYFKLHRKRIWYTATGAIFWSLFSIYAWALFSIPLYLFYPDSSYLALVAIPIAYFIFDSLITSLFLSLGPINQPMKLIVMTPLIRIIQLIAYARTFWRTKFTWSGIHYQFDSRGRVININRK
ncbi:MAG: glycosyltransferase family 2 protein [Patescibacteria group bacterium]